MRARADKVCKAKWRDKAAQGEEEQRTETKGLGQNPGNTHFEKPGAGRGKRPPCQRNWGKIKPTSSALASTLPATPTPPGGKPMSSRTPQTFPGAFARRILTAWSTSPSSLPKSNTISFRKMPQTTPMQVFLFTLKLMSADNWSDHVHSKSVRWEPGPPGSSQLSKAIQTSELPAIEAERGAVSGNITLVSVEVENGLELCSAFTEHLLCVRHPELFLGCVLIKLSHTPGKHLIPFTVNVWVSRYLYNYKIFYMLTNT